MVSFYHYSELDLLIQPNALRRLALRRRRYEAVPGSAGLIWRIPRWYGTSATEKGIAWNPYMQEFGEAVRELMRLDGKLSSTRDQVELVQS